MDAPELAALVRAHQEHLLSGLQEYVQVGDRVRAAFHAVPRHAFASPYRRYGDPGWHHVDEANLHLHLPAIYRDDGLGIFGDDESGVTISWPSMVLQMLELLDLAPGLSVFELGTGSGWNAALLGHLVAPGGEVETVEIIPELAARARRSIAAAGVSNVHVVLGDGGFGPTLGRPLDRAVYTAGAYDIPRLLHQHVRVGGRLLFVLKVPGGGDVLALLRRAEDHFVSVALRPCEFVPVTGAARDGTQDAVPLARFTPWAQVRDHVVRRRPLFALRDRARGFALRSFLGIVHPSLRYFLDGDGRTTFGSWDETTRSFVLAHGDALVSYGGPEAGDALERALVHWLSLGMPSVTDLEVRAYPRAAAPPPRSDAWSVRREHTEFVWEMPRTAA